MFEKFLSQNAGDFRQRYEGTYGFYRDENGKRMLAKLNSISERVCIFVDARGIEYNLNADSTKDIGFEFIPPKSGYFNTDKGALFVQRVPARQFSRGINQRNTGISLLSAGSHFKQEISFPLMVSIYEQSKTAKESFPDFLKKAIPSWAVTSQFCLDHGSYIWVYQEAIGQWAHKKEKFIVTLKDKTMYKTELTDAFRAIDYPVEFS